ncbi:MAG: 4-(cytidine 5'-diphospho)-2-C-methyl-D-erythritol kinase [Candidatus Electronema sp. V4]|uniref:4-(cytidine 5'-diphospho)-2-C-methyl-D-erythritol kinase n=1 Tax=Candidatus Electronema sp. V4 TaxID=3454756 RepID=UPI00405544EA
MPDTTPPPGQSCSSRRILMIHAPAKINLYLKILGRRPDGYHELDTLMQKVALYDELDLSLTDTDTPGIRFVCKDAGLPEDEGNIVFRAAMLFLEQTGRAGQGVRIVLRKRIPLAAGLGGGSSDAAAVLTGLNQLAGAGCTTEELAAMGLRLGADVPFFVYDHPAAWAGGIGERLEPAVPLRGFTVLLVNPGIAVSTKWAYETFSQTAGRIALTEAGKKFNLSNFSNESGLPLRRRAFLPADLLNDLELVTAEKHRVIGELKARILAAGAAGAMMSGSGSTVFGLFSAGTEAQAESCLRELRQEYGQACLAAPLI